MRQGLRAQLVVLSSLLLTGACSYKEAAPATASDDPPMASNDTLAFVQAACGGCHAVEPGYLSPSPGAPRWEDIANRERLNEATLASWLYDAHNYPEMMDFDLNRARAEEIVAYMLAMRSDDYKPLPE